MSRSHQDCVQASASLSGCSVLAPRSAFTGGGRLVIIAGLLSCAVACGGGAQERLASIRHPTRENADRPEAEHVVRVTDSLGRRPNLNSAARVLRRMRVVATIGDSTSFGSIADVAIDSQGTAYVLDGSLNRVYTIDRSGVIRHAFGRAGQGPEEFQAPEAIEVAGPVVLVSDRHRRVKLFHHTPRGFALVRTVQLDVVPEGMCATRNEFFVVRPRQRDETLIHGYTLAGLDSISFGEPYRSSSWFVRDQLSDGAVACHDNSSIVTFAFELTPLVFGYRRGGELAWVSRVADFQPMQVVEQAPGGVPELAYEGARPHHSVVTLIPMAADVVVLQVAWHTAESWAQRADYAELHTYLLSSSDGEGVYVGRHLPQLTAVRPPRAYGFRNDPYPGVLILSDGDLRAR